MSEPLVVEVVRSDLVESVHRADCAVVDASGRPRAAAGDPGTVAYFRSAAKPLQAAVCLEQGWAPADERHVAVACGSHSGEDAHRTAVVGILAAAGLDPAALRCPAARPWSGVGEESRVAHNCSGKHAALLATAAARAWPLETYRDPDHPLQREVLTRIEHWAGARVAVGVDGCGVPTFATTLAAVARAFAALGSDGGGLPRAAAAMRAHPFFVAGTGRVCTALMEAAPGILAKVGAEGLGCLLLPSGEAAAFKVRDGSARAREALVAGVAALLGALPSPAPSALEPFLRPPVTGGGRPVGVLRVRGALAPL